MTETCIYCDRPIYPLNSVMWATDPTDRQTRWCIDREDGVPRHHRPDK